MKVRTFVDFVYTDNFFAYAVVTSSLNKLSSRAMYVPWDIHVEKLCAYIHTDVVLSLTNCCTDRALVSRLQ